MHIGDRFLWRQETHTPSAGEAVEAALPVDRAKLSYGSTPNGGAPPLRRPVLIGHEKHEQVIARTAAYLSTGERRDLEARYLRGSGRALFDARFVKLEMRPP